MDAEIKCANSIKLRYISDGIPGIKRRRAGKGFYYIDTDGETIRDETTLGRIKALVIPPAWQKVWICPFANGHLQATGLDDRGRKQYRYHNAWRQARDENKYEHMIAFAAALPKIRRVVARDLKQRGLPRTKVLAAIVRLLEKTLIRVGNEQYVRENKSFGLTTLRNRHAKIRGASLHLGFKGKSGIYHQIDLEDRKLARLISKLQELPGQELFQYKNDNGEIASAGSHDVNVYLQEITGEEFTAKDFRTWNGTVLAVAELRKLKPFDSQAQAKRNVRFAIEKVAHQLGNTPAICKKCYVHPAIVESYIDGTFLQKIKGPIDSTRDLRVNEMAVLTLINKS